MMNKLLKLSMSVFFQLILLFSGWICWANEHKVAVIVPMEHQAMDDIVEGIQENLGESDYKISIHRAHGDLNILVNILNQIHYQKFDSVIAIGTATSQMALSHLPKDVVVICAATSLCPDRQKAYSINDSVDISEMIKKLPRLKNLGICYSAQDKNILEVRALKKALQDTEIVLEERVVHTIQDLPTAVHSFSSNVQAILLLKDHLTISALPVFIRECAIRKIPLIASDESSVSKGAAMAFGVQEKEIGQLSAEVLKKHFDHKDPPVVSSLTPFAKLYINKKRFAEQALWHSEDIMNIGWTVVEVGA